MVPISQSTYNKPLLATMNFGSTEVQNWRGELKRQLIILAVVSLFNFRIQRWESLSSLFKLKLRELQTIKIEWSKRFLILHYLRDWYTFCKTLRSFRLQSLLSSQLYNEKNQCWISRTENYIQLCRVPSMPVLDKCNLSPGYFFKNGLYFTTIWISESQGSLTVKTWRTW